MENVLPEALKDRLTEFLRRLRESLCDVKTYLFGSHARGDWLLESDVDIIVISSAFEGMEWWERVGMVKRLAPPGLVVSPLTYTPAEFRERLRSSAVLQDAMEYAVRLT